MNGIKFKAYAGVTFMLIICPILRATNVLPGYDLFKTLPESNSYFQFVDPPIPADFFGPGSDPFYGIVYLQGEPLSTTPSGTLDSTDLILRRPDEATLPSCGTNDTVPVEIVALNLVSVNPITVTFNGGQFNELWDVDMCLSGSEPQQPGTMTITHGCDEGGTFDGQFQLLPNFTFTQEDDPSNQRNLDYGTEGLPPVQLETTQGYWTHSDHGLNILSSPGGVTVDHDCDGAIDMPIGPGSNFLNGVVGSPCFCGNEPFAYDIVTTYFQDSNQWVRLGVVPPQSHTDIPVLSEWGMLIMTLLILVMGTVTAVRKRKAAPSENS